MKKIKKIILTIALLCLLLPQKVYAKEFTQTLYSTSAVLMDGESKRVLFGKKENEKMPNASTTKIMTLIVTLEHCDLQEMVEVSAYAQSMPSVKCNIRKGEKYRLYDLVCSMMLESHNDSAVAIAEHVAGTVEAFCDMMNEKAKEIGCENTYFITPNGLDGEVVLQDGTKVTHGTTALELAKIMAYCVLESPRKDKFLEITQKRTHVFCDSTGKRSFTCRNHNALLDMRDGILSGKTGFTSKAGYCYVGAMESDGRVYIIALLACGWPNHKTYKWLDAQKLLNYGEQNFHRASYKRVKLQKQCLDELVVSGKRFPIKINKGDAPQTVLVQEGEELHIEMERIMSIKGKMNAGEWIGDIKYMVGDEVIYKLPLFSSGNASIKKEK